MCIPSEIESMSCFFSKAIELFSSHAKLCFKKVMSCEACTYLLLTSALVL